jgi:cytochrome d ubiquinol oxidase subunit I
MNVLTLSQLQFAATAMFHFLFVPLTLGLSVMTAWMETKYVTTGDEQWLRMTKFWGKLFLINFALGVVTGITMEFQFGMNWAEYSKFVGDIFGAPLAIEATVTFFLESVFIGVWIFGWNKISKKVHALTIWLAAIGTNLSALWILLANGWMQHPVGAKLVEVVNNPLINRRMEMDDFLAVVTNPYGWNKFLHQISSAYVLAAFFVMGISAWHLLRKNETSLFTQSFKSAALFGLLSCFAVLGTGHSSGVEVAKYQPSKLAAMESIWESQSGAGMSLLVIPDVKNGKNLVEALTIPKLASLIAYNDPNATIKGLNDPEVKDKYGLPPILATFLSFRTMVGIGTVMVVLNILAWFLSRSAKLESSTVFLRVMVLAIPLPYLAIQFGWLVAELGRQPWAVYGVLKTADSVSKSLDVSQVAISLGAFTLIYSLLGAVDFYLLAKYAKKGPDTDVSSIISTNQGRA